MTQPDPSSDNGSKATKTTPRAAHRKHHQKWLRLDPRARGTSKRGRLSNVAGMPQQRLEPLAPLVEVTTNIEDGKRVAKPRLDESGEPIPKRQDEAIGGWDIEAHSYDHTCSEKHARPCGIDGCPECNECPACNPQHPDHWAAAQLSVLRIPDCYIAFVAELPEASMFGGQRVDEGRYVEFLNDDSTRRLRSSDGKLLPERERCIAPGGCIDRTLRFLAAHDCFSRSARASVGYVRHGAHKPACDKRKNRRRDGSTCEGCLRVPYAPGCHTKDCEFKRGCTRADGSPCPGCATRGTIWFSHFGGGYDINFVLRWLSEANNRAVVLRSAVMTSCALGADSGDADRDAEARALRDVFDARYQYRAETILGGSTHVEMKIAKLSLRLPKAKPSDESKAAWWRRPKRGWLHELLALGLGDAENTTPREAKRVLNLMSRRKPFPDTDLSTTAFEKALAEFQVLVGTGAGRRRTERESDPGTIDRETSAALRVVASRAKKKPSTRDTLCFRDSFRLVGSKLEDAARDFDLVDPRTGGKLRKIDTIDVRNPPPPDDPDYRRYCRIDAEICVQLVTIFRQLIMTLGGTLEMTASSSAMALFRRKFLREPVERNRHFAGCRMLCPECGTETCSPRCGTQRGKESGENQAAHRARLDAHEHNPRALCPTFPCGCFHFSAIAQTGHRHGGHVEVLRQRLDRGRCYDVNSLYPFAMLGPLPTGKMRRYVTPTPEEQKWIAAWSELQAREANAPATAKQKKSDSKRKKESSPREADRGTRLPRLRNPVVGPGALVSASRAWQHRLTGVATDPRWAKLVERHGLDFAALEALYRSGAQPDPSDPDMIALDAFRRARQCGYVEAIVTIPGGAPVEDGGAAESYFPPLPVVRETETIDGKSELLFWPVGTFAGWWCYEELRALLQVPGARLDAVRQSVWFHGEPLLAEFVETLYALRRSPDASPALRQLLKILLNSLYGKTLQNPLKRRVLRLQAGEDRPKGWLPTTQHYSDPYRWPWVTTQHWREPIFFLPHWGSLITARARIVLWQLVVSIERGDYGDGKHVYYGDTDSIYTDAVIPSDPKKLGALKLEYVSTAEEESKRQKAIRDDFATTREALLTAIREAKRAGGPEREPRVTSLLAQLAYARKDRDMELSAPGHKRPRPAGEIAARFHRAKLYTVLDPETLDEVKAVAKGMPGANAEKIERFLRGETIRSDVRAPKGGAGLLDDFEFVPAPVERKNHEDLWRRPAKDEPPVHNKRVHHYDGRGYGTTTPRCLDPHEEFLYERGFDARETTTAARLYETWTGRGWAAHESDMSERSKAS